jgi:pimeloyl-ACP methyl ester carboxylesterase
MPFKCRAADVIRRVVPLLVALAAAARPASAQDVLDYHHWLRQHPMPPLVIREQGSFFVGGQTKHVGADADVTIYQMYVQYQIPDQRMGHLPVVMLHGCCLSGKTYETTPDGRMGWAEYFLRHGRAVYIPDQSGRGRSGYDATPINRARTGDLPASELPPVTQASYQFAWSVFRFGPTYGAVFPNEQFPMKHVDELFNQMIPDINAELPTPNPTWTNLGTLAEKLNGAVLMGHSQSGFFPLHAALINPKGVRGLISVEHTCDTFTPDEITKLARFPTLIVFGDHLDDIVGSTQWPTAFANCENYVAQVKAAGGDVTLLHLPDIGIRGNSHMMMQDKNNLQIADLLLDWIDTHVEHRPHHH